jgi:hypothetical protein
MGKLLHFGMTTTDQTKTLVFMATDTEFLEDVLSTLTRKELLSNVITNPYHNSLASYILDFYTEHGKAPGWDRAKTYMNGLKGDGK